MNFVVGKKYNGTTVQCNFPDDLRTEIDEIGYDPQSGDNLKKLVEFGTCYLWAEYSSNMGTKYYKVYYHDAIDYGGDMSLYAASQSSDGIFLVENKYTEFDIAGSTQPCSAVTSDAYLITQYLSIEGMEENKEKNIKYKTSASGYKEIGMNNLKQVVPMRDMKIKILDDGSQWARIFWHDVSTNAVFFTDSSEARDCNLSNRFSKLAYLSDYIYGDRFEFMLCYPKYSTTKYNRWTQTLNPLNIERDTNSIQTVATMGYKAVHIDFTDHWFYGVGMSSNSNTYMDCEVGHGDWFGALGVYSATAYSGGLPAPTETGMSANQKEVELWVRVNTGIKIVSKDEYAYDIASDKVYVHNATELHNLRNSINSSTDGFANKKIILMNNISSTEANFTPINTFNGEFDGNGFKIVINMSNTTANSTSGFIKTNGGTIKNLRISGENTTTNSGSYSLLCGINNGLIDNCYVPSTGMVLSSTTSTNYCGLICGQNNGIIQKCISEGTVSATTSSGSFSGGICGQNNGKIYSSRSNANISGYNSGGICGSQANNANNAIENCNFNGVPQSTSGYIGGVCGYVYGGKLNNNLCTVATNGVSSSYNGQMCGVNYNGTGTGNYCLSGQNIIGSSIGSSTISATQTTIANMKSRLGIWDKLGFRWTFQNTRNNGLPSFNWEKVSDPISDAKSTAGNYENIWTDYLGGDTINIYLQNSWDYCGKNNLLEVTVYDGTIYNPTINETTKYTIKNPSTLEKISLPITSKDVSVAYLYQIEATWSNAAGGRSYDACKLCKI